MTEHQAASSLDLPRPAATSPDQYTLTIEDALVRYEHAGHPRTVRSIQRYCAKGHLDCLRQETMFGDKFMITPQSVARHIAQIDELASAAKRDMPGQDATPVATHQSGDTELRLDPPSPDQSRPVAVSRAEEHPPAVDDRYVRQLEGEVVFLRDQVQRKDSQIGELTERAKETNFLIKGLQDLVLRLQPGSSRELRDASQTSQD